MIKARNLLVATAAGALLAVATLGACAPAPLKDTLSDGHFKAGKDIKRGTWRTANAGPSSATCMWTVWKKAGDGSTVTLFSEQDTKNRIQTVYLAGGDEFDTNASCGTWGWVTAENLTQGGN